MFTSASRLVDHCYVANIKVTREKGEESYAARPTTHVKVRGRFNSPAGEHKFPLLRASLRLSFKLSGRNRRAAQWNDAYKFPEIGENMKYLSLLI